MRDSSERIENPTGFGFVIRSALAGGLAGGIAKTAVAPLDRIKILFQTHNVEFRQFSGSWKGAVNAMQLIVKTQGFRGLYQGHTLTLARAVPHAAIGYTIYEQTNRMLMPTHESQTSFKRFLAGAVTGLSAMPFTYPFELIRVRMAIEMKHHSCRPSPLHAVRTIWTEGKARYPLLSFYRGFAVSALGTVPYRGGIFLIWETLNARTREQLSPETLNRYQARIHLCIGAIAGTVAQVTTYPLEVIRRTQQASGAGSPERMIGFRETVIHIWKQGSWRGFFSGLGIGLLKQVPMHSISLVTWQITKGFLRV